MPSRILCTLPYFISRGTGSFGQGEREILSYTKRCIQSGALGTASPALGNLGREVRNQKMREVGLHNRVRFDW